jgi:hypothetical protein
MSNTLPNFPARTPLGDKQATNDNSYREQIWFGIDTHIWRLSATGHYSAKSAYEGLFLGTTGFEPCQRIWKTWGLPKCKFFLWLAAHSRCWNTDYLARRGLDHPEKCPLCDQEDETLKHLLVSCAFHSPILVSFASPGWSSVLISTT